MAQQRVEWVEYRISTSFTTHVDWSMTKTNTITMTKGSSSNLHFLCGLATEFNISNFRHNSFEILEFPKKRT